MSVVFFLDFLALEACIESSLRGNWGRERGGGSPVGSTAPSSAYQAPAQPNTKYFTPLLSPVSVRPGTYSQFTFILFL